MPPDARSSPRTPVPISAVAPPAHWARGGGLSSPASHCRERGCIFPPLPEPDAQGACREHWNAEQWAIQQATGLAEAYRRPGQANPAIPAAPRLPTPNELLELACQWAFTCCEFGPGFDAVPISTVVANWRQYAKAQTGCALIEIDTEPMHYVLKGHRANLDKSGGQGRTVYTGVRLLPKEK